MKIIKFIIGLFLMAALGAIVLRAVAQVGELKEFSAEPDFIKPGVVTTFNFVFNTPMDTSVNPIAHFNMPDNNNLYLPTYWNGDYTCRLSFSFPNSRESGNAEVTLTGLKTQDGKDIGEVNAVVKVFERQTPAPAPRPAAR